MEQRFDGNEAALRVGDLQKKKWHNGTRQFTCFSRQHGKNLDAVGISGHSCGIDDGSVRIGGGGSAEV